MLVLLILDGLRLPLVMEKVEPVRAEQNQKYRFIRYMGAGLICLLMGAAASSLLLINNGLEAPGVALSVAPMVKVPEQYRHPVSGQFFLVTVVSQSPITAGEWVLGKIDPALQLLPPEKISRNNITPQQDARQGYQMLNDSETTAIAVGLQLAGYKTAVIGKGVSVVSILEGQPCQRSSSSRRYRHGTEWDPDPYHRGAYRRD